MYEIEIISGFSAAHWLRDYKGKCEHLHGHNYRVHVILRAGTIGPGGMVIDFGDIKRITNEVVDKLDHICLNDVPPFDSVEPSAENIAAHIFQEVQDRLEDRGGLLHCISVWESDTSRASFVRDNG